jgi:leucyl-tRNA synthetase
MAKLQVIQQLEKKFKDIVSAPNAEVNQGLNKSFVTFPYPYMNGSLHLGHAFTMMGPELRTRYKKARWYNVLFPFGFHGSGMGEAY